MLFLRGRETLHFGDTEVVDKAEQVQYLMELHLCFSPTNNKYCKLLQNVMQLIEMQFPSRLL